MRRGDHMPPLKTPFEHARATLAAHRHYRADWLQRLDAGTATPLDLLKDAATPQGRPLLRLTMRQVLLSVPHSSVGAVEKLLRQLRDVTDCYDLSLGKVTVAWLLDNRCKGSRQAAWIGLEKQARNTPPWPGYPFTRPTRKG